MTPGLVLKHRDEAREVDLGLMAGRRLEANLVWLRPIARTDRRHEPLHGGVVASVATLAQLPRQARCRQVGKAATRSRT